MFIEGLPGAMYRKMIDEKSEASLSVKHEMGAFSVGRASTEYACWLRALGERRVASIHSRKAGMDLELVENVIPENPAPLIFADNPRNVPAELASRWSCVCIPGMA